MRKNVGTIDATIRITAGLLGLAYGVGRMARRPYRVPWLLMTLSAMKVAEGVTRFCPMLYAMGTDTRRGPDLAKWNRLLSQMGATAGAAGEREQRHAAEDSGEREHRQTGKAAQMESAELASQLAEAAEEIPGVEELVNSLTGGPGSQGTKEGLGRPKRARKVPKRLSPDYRQEEHIHPIYS